MSSPKILDLDDLELPETNIVIKHKGEEHKMRVLTVDMFIAQQQRAAKHEAAVKSGLDVASTDGIEDIVKIIRDAVSDFFPTLPVGEIETAKLFRIFGWLNEITEQVNEQSAPEGSTEGESAEGKEVEPSETATES